MGQDKPITATKVVMFEHGFCGDQVSLAVLCDNVTHLIDRYNRVEYRIVGPL